MLTPTFEHPVNHLRARVSQVYQSQLGCQLHILYLKCHRVHLILGCLLCYQIAVGDDLDSLALGEGPVVKELIEGGGLTLEETLLDNALGLRICGFGGSLRVQLGNTCESVEELGV